MREVILRLEQNFLTKQEDLDILESYEIKNIFPDIIFDFTELGFNDIGMSIILTFALKNKDEGRKFSYKFNEQAAKVKETILYLKYFGFLKLLFDENYILNPTYEHNIPYKKFTHKDIRSFLEITVRKWIKTHLKNKRGDIEPLLTAILEACNNIKDHSEAAYGLFMAFHNPEKNELRFCISDTGGGIPKKIKSSVPYENLSDAEALQKSLEYGVSTAKAQGRGAGLPHLLSAIIDCYKGKLDIITGGVWLTTKNGNNLTIDPLEGIGFGGTVIAISINLYYIPEIDTTEFIYEPSGDVWNV